MRNWRDEPITEKQQRLIDDMQEFSEYPLPLFSGTTKGEAYDYIDKWIGKSHETVLDCWDTSQGIP